MIACEVNVGFGSVEYAKRGTNDMVGARGKKKRNPLVTYGSERGGFHSLRPYSLYKQHNIPYIKHGPSHVNIISASLANIIALSH